MIADARDMCNQRIAACFIDFNIGRCLRDLNIDVAFAADVDFVVGARVDLGVDGVGSWFARDRELGEECVGGNGFYGCDCDGVGAQAGDWCGGEDAGCPWACGKDGVCCRYRDALPGFFIGVGYTIGFSATAGGGGGDAADWGAATGAGRGRGGGFGVVDVCDGADDETRAGFFREAHHRRREVVWMHLCGFAGAAHFLVTLDQLGEDPVEVFREAGAGPGLLRASDGCVFARALT